LKLGETSTLGVVSAVDTIMAVPLPASWSAYSFAFDPGASRAVLSFGGLGQAPFDWDLDAEGIVLTGVFNFATPALFIALGVAFDQSSGWSDTAKAVVPKILSLVESAANGPVGEAMVGDDPSLEDVLSAIANVAASLLTAALTGSEQLAAYITIAVGESAAEEATPFLGWIALAIGAAADVASMVETSVEVAASPATMAIDVLRTMDVLVTVEPDPRHQDQWPDTATRYSIAITYADGTLYAYDGTMSPTTQQGPIARTFPGLPAGGSLSVLACFYSATDWVAGKGTSGSVAAEPDRGSTLAVPPFAIVENLVPLTASTTYNFKQKLVDSGGGRAWAGAGAVAAPSATVSDLDASDVGDNLWQLAGLALNEPASSLGYVWAASGQGVPLVDTDEPYRGQEFTFQNVNDEAVPESGLRFSGVGYTAKPCIAYPPASAANPSASSTPTPGPPARPSTPAKGRGRACCRTRSR